ncbi:hypothetical protein L103DPR2_00691 [Limnohabitans sp. 103DPR2]|nr:hypothetical protein L103DPR2_00691 [Limnohabitans sp. 103DPR2]
MRLKISKVGFPDNFPDIFPDIFPDTVSNAQSIVSNDWSYGSNNSFIFSNRPSLCQLVKMRGNPDPARSPKLIIKNICCSVRFRQSLSPPLSAWATGTRSAPGLRNSKPEGLLMTRTEARSD